MAPALGRHEVASRCKTAELEEPVGVRDRPGGRKPPPLRDAGGNRGELAKGDGAVRDDEPGRGVADPAGHRASWNAVEAAEGQDIGHNDVESIDRRTALRAQAQVRTALRRVEDEAAVRAGHDRPGGAQHWIRSNRPRRLDHREDRDVGAVPARRHPGAAQDRARVDGERYRSRRGGRDPDVGTPHRLAGATRRAVGVSHANLCRVGTLGHGDARSLARGVPDDDLDRALRPGETSQPDDHAPPRLGVGTLSAARGRCRRTHHRERQRRARSTTDTSPAAHGRPFWLAQPPRRRLGEGVGLDARTSRRHRRLPFGPCPLRVRNVCQVPSGPLARARAAALFALRCTRPGVHETPADPAAFEDVGTGAGFVIAAVERAVQPEPAALLTPAGRRGGASSRIHVGGRAESRQNGSTESSQAPSTSCSHDAPPSSSAGATSCPARWNRGRPARRSPPRVFRRRRTSVRHLVRKKGAPRLLAPDLRPGGPAAVPRDRQRRPREPSGAGSAGSK